MPQERDSQYPVTTAEEIEAAPGTREQKSARLVVARRITGIPRRNYLLGECDNAPVCQGVADLTAAAWALLDEIDRINLDNDGEAAKLDPDGFGRIVGLGTSLRVILTDHGCPEGDTT